MTKCSNLKIVWTTSKDNISLCFTKTLQFYTKTHTRFSFYSDEEFDPEKYNEVSDENLLDSPNKRDLTGLTMNFTVGKQKVVNIGKWKVVNIGKQKVVNISGVLWFVFGIEKKLTAFLLDKTR